VSEVKGAASLREQSSAIAPGSSARRPLRIALFGFGTVGSSVARILSDSKPDVLKLSHIFNRSVSRKRVEWVPSDVVWTEDAEAVQERATGVADRIDVLELDGDGAGDP